MYLNIICRWMFAFFTVLESFDRTLIIYEVTHTQLLLQKYIFFNTSTKVRSKVIKWQEQLGNSIHVYAAWMLLRFTNETFFFFLPLYIPLCYIFL